MLWGNTLFAAGISAALAGAAAQPAATVYRIDLAGGQTAWSQDKPREAAGAIVFHRYPGGLLVSVKKDEVRKVTASARPAEAIPGLRPKKDIVVIGQTAPSSSAEESGAPGSRDAGTLPGERRDGTALLNPDRKFKPEWDTKQVPGMNLPYPNSPNDYREGKTFAYPPAPATQTAPGDLPRMPEGNGELPRGPGQ